MIDWDRTAVERCLGLTATYREWSSPLGLHIDFIFDIPFPGGPIHFSVRPNQDHCQFYSEGPELVSAHVHCTRIVIHDEPDEEGGPGLVLIGRAGHAGIVPGKPYFRLFFSMYGDQKSVKLPPTED